MSPRETMRYTAVWAVAAAVDLSYAGHEVRTFSDDVLCISARGSMLCPASAGCCDGFCCGYPRPSSPDAPSFNSPGLNFMPVLVGIVFFVAISCMIGICVAGIIRACRHRNRSPPFESYPTAAAPYPPQAWSPAPVPMGGSGAWPPMPVPVRAPAGGAGAWPPAPTPTPAPAAASANDPPPPYHTVVTGAPPC